MLVVQGFWLADLQWEAFSPLLPGHHPGACRVDDDRHVLTGIVHMLKNGGRWQDCPRCDGPWVSVANAIRTASPLQRGISNPSEAQRRLEAGAMTAPSCQAPHAGHRCSRRQRWSRRPGQCGPPGAPFHR
jgi:transposase